MRFDVTTLQQLFRIIARVVSARPIYTLQNNAQTKFADWVAYRVTPNTIDGPSRSRNWQQDPNIPATQTMVPADYNGAHATIGTDRGHQVPLASFSNTAHWATTNYLSNITPRPNWWPAQRVRLLESGGYYLNS